MKTELGGAHVHQVKLAVLSALACLGCLITNPAAGSKSLTDAQMVGLGFVDLRPFSQRRVIGRWIDTISPGRCTKAIESIEKRFFEVGYCGYPDDGRWGNELKRLDKRTFEDRRADVRYAIDSNGKLAVSDRNGRIDTLRPARQSVDRSLLSITADVLDVNAPRGVANSFDVTDLTVKQVQKRAGTLKVSQAVAIRCAGHGMGSNGLAAFDLFSGPGAQINGALRKLGVTPDTQLDAVCRLNQKEFERRQRTRR
jgi:hypothetical protein